jgi:hypothetical protein
VKRGTPATSAARSHIRVSSISVSPTSNATTLGALRAIQPPARGRGRRDLEQPLVARDGRDPPPAASTRDAQSTVALDERPPQNRRDERLGVWTVTSSARTSVSATTPSATRLTVSVTGKVGTAPSKPSPERLDRR